MLFASNMNFWTAWQMRRSYTACSSHHQSIGSSGLVRTCTPNSLGQYETADSWKFLLSGKLHSWRWRCAGETACVFQRLDYLFLTPNMWRRHDLGLSLKGQLYNTIMRRALLYRCGTPPTSLRHPSPGCIWRRLLTYYLCLVTGTQKHAAECSAWHTTKSHRMNWSKIESACPALAALHVICVPRDWVGERKGQAITWHRRMNKQTTCLLLVGAIWIVWWGPNAGKGTRVCFLYRHDAEPDSVIGFIAWLANSLYFG